VSAYESDKLLGEYLLFHYGTAEEVLPYPLGPREALDYAVRCVTECLPPGRYGRALDLGCAVGRSSFELARQCESVTGIDLSRRFISAADELRQKAELAYERVDEGALRTPLVARVPREIDRDHVTFEVGDATALRPDLGAFEVVLAANLIDRLRDPERFLDRLRDLVLTGGHLIISSPYTWLEEFTPRERWLGGFMAAEGHTVSTFEALQQRLRPHFTLECSTSPF
jgi:putative 4-mercaptohistidine N1-methyltranferase